MGLGQAGAAQGAGKTEARPAMSTGEAARGDDAPEGRAGAAVGWSDAAADALVAVACAFVAAAVFPDVGFAEVVVASARSGWEKGI